MQAILGSNPLFVVILIILALIAFVMLFFDTKVKKPKDEKQDPAKKSQAQPLPQKDEAGGQKEKTIGEPKEKHAGSGEQDGQDAGSEKKPTNDDQQEKPKLIFKRKKSQDKNKKLRASHKKSVEQVYQKVATKKSMEAKADMVPSISEDELLDKMCFVKTSKNVYKLVKRDENSEMQAFQDELEDALEQYQGGDPELDELKSQLLMQSHGHFDKSRRLSRCVKNNDFDDMFSSHITDRYLNIDTNRHLAIDDHFNEKLFRRASQTIAGSNRKVVVGTDEEKQKYLDKYKIQSNVEDAEREELAKLLVEKDYLEEAQESQYSSDILQDFGDINAKNLVLGQMLMTRKKRAKR